MRNWTNTSGVVRTLAMVATVGAVTTVAVSAQARWRGAAPCLKALGERTRTGDEYAWALSCTLSGSNYKIVHSHSNGGDQSWQWSADPQGGAGTAITVRDGIPFVATADSNLWWKQGPGGGGTVTDGGTWIRYPNNRCGGGAITIKQLVGDPTVAVGDGFTAYLLDLDGQVIRWSNTSQCWASLPKFSFRRAQEIAIWGGSPPGQRTRAWVVLDNSQIFRLSDADTWQLVPNGNGVGISTGSVIGVDGTSRWNINFTTGTFTRDTAWTSGAISQLTSSWIVAKSGIAYHWE